MKKIFLLIGWLLSVFCYKCPAQINSRFELAVQFKSGMADAGIPFFEDMSFGVPGDVLVKKLKEMGVNTFHISVANAMVKNDRGDILVDFIKKIKDNGGGHFGIVLNQRKWHINKEDAQESWADDIAYAYNVLDAAGLSDMVVGCSFGENRALKGKQSTTALWKKRFFGVIGAMDKLNDKTDNAFKTRTVAIHGKGYGSQFRGVKTSSEKLDFPHQMSTRCAGVVYNFKFFQTGIPEDKSLEGWKQHFKEYCKLEALAQMGAKVVFVGDSSDGLRGSAFKKNPYGGPGPHVIFALRDVFNEYNWSRMAMGPFMKDGESFGRAILFKVKDGNLISREPQIDSWNTWKESTRPVVFLENKSSGYKLFNDDATSSKIIPKAKTSINSSVKWKIRTVPGDHRYIRIQHIGSKRYIISDKDGTTPRLVAAGFFDTQNAYWRPIPVPKNSGYYYLKQVETGKLLSFNDNLDNNLHLVNAGETNDNVKWKLDGSGLLRNVEEPNLATKSFDEIGPKITVYPNPVSKELNIKFDQKLASKELSSASIITPIGQIIDTFKLNKSNTRHNVSQLAPGLYFLKVVAAGKTLIFRFLKNNSLIW